MENIIYNINQFPKINDVIEVARVETILSKFHVAIEEVKRKVKRFLQSSQGNLALVIIDFYCISDNHCVETEFKEAIDFAEVRGEKIY